MARVESMRQEKSILPSTVLMTAIPAKVAGVPEVVLAVPVFISVSIQCC